MAEPIVVYVDPDLEEIVPRYLSNKTREIEEMENGLARGDFESVRILGHSLKGSGGGYGFDMLTEIGAAIEIAAKAADTQAIRGELQRLVDYLQRVEVVYAEQE